MRLALFTRARAEIGLPLLITKANSLRGNKRWNYGSSFEDAFFSTRLGYSLANLSGVPNQYKRIWKCGNNDLRCTLYDLADKNTNGLTGFGDGVIIDGKRVKLDFGDSYPPRAGIPLFTLVRDPIFTLQFGFT